MKKINIIKIFFAVTLLITSSWLLAGQVQTDIMEKDYTIEEIEEYFGEYMALIKRPYLKDGAVIELDIGQYTVVESLGKGQEGLVFTIRNNQTDEVSALKLPFYYEEEPKVTSDGYIKPLKLLKSLIEDGNPNIIRVNADSRFMIMEKADGVVNYIEPTEADSGNGFFKQACLQILDGMEYLQSKGIIFGDLHLGNVVYFKKPDGTITFKIIDINGVNKEYTNTTVSIKEYMKDMYRGLRINDSELLMRIRSAETVGELRLIIDPNTDEKLLDDQLQDLDISEAKVKLRLKNRTHTESKDRRKGMFFKEEDEDGATGGC